MQKLVTAWLAVGAVYLGGAPAEAAEAVKIARAPWCPYICNDPLKPGALAEVVAAAFAAKSMSVTYTTLPWARELAMTRSGEMDAMLGVGKNDAPDLVYPSRSTGRYQPCFYTLPGSKWEYQGVDSLKAVRLSVLQNQTFAPEVDAYIGGEGKKSGKVDFLHDENYLAQHFLKLEAKRVDVMLDDANVVRYHLENARKANQFRQAGCLRASAIWLGFSPAGKNTKAYMAAYELGLDTIRKSGQLKTILSKYGIDESSF